MQRNRRKYKLEREKNWIIISKAVFKNCCCKIPIFLSRNKVKMATCAEKESEFSESDELYSEHDALYIGRFVYDVVVYTLTKCGFPEAQLPTTECKETVYKRADIVEIAGASSLRVALIMRDTWKQMFLSRRNSSGFREDKMLKFLAQLTLCCPLSRDRPTQSMVELFLALSNEIMLFFHHENINVDLTHLLKSVSIYIVGFFVMNEDLSTSFEDLFDEFDNISKYTTWITSFITDFAVPYGSIDVSERFFEYVKKLYKDELQKLKDQLGFLPHDLFIAIQSETLERLIQESRPPAVPECSRSRDMEERESPEKQTTPSTEVSEQILKGGQGSSGTGLEDSLEQMSLGAEGGSSSNLGEISGRKGSKKKHKSKRS